MFLDITKRATKEDLFNLLSIALVIFISKGTTIGNCNGIIEAIAVVSMLSALVFNCNFVQQKNPLRFFMALIPFWPLWTKLKVDSHSSNYIIIGGGDCKGYLYI
ncbi:hypothetical protein [Alkaliphilus transvaalensis]|uniref:hypothetical protein n=1 Tax=Alkaliphilus transvaalensis TaxID=114628 RepID=UPI00047C738A|nr:hypothetical protein [Alkaliphilus transvaalensis]